MTKCFVSIAVAWLLAFIMVGCAGSASEIPSSPSDNDKNVIPSSSQLESSQAPTKLLDATIADNMIALADDKIIYALGNADVPTLSLHIFDIQTERTQELIKLNNVTRYSGDYIVAGDYLFLIIPDASKEKISSAGEIIEVENRVIRIDLKNDSAEAYDTYRSLNAITFMTPMNQESFLLSYTIQDGLELSDSIAVYNIADKTIVPLVTKQMTKSSVASTWGSWQRIQKSYSVTGDNIFSFCVSNNTIYSIEAKIAANVEYFIAIYNLKGEPLDTFSLNGVEGIAFMDEQNNNYFKRIFVLGNRIFLEDYTLRCFVLQKDKSNGYTASVIESARGFYDSSLSPNFTVILQDQKFLLADITGQDFTINAKENMRCSAASIYKEKAVLQYMHEKTGERMAVYYTNLMQATV